MIKEILKQWCPRKIYKMYADTKYWIRFKFYPKGLASEMFRGILGYELNWDNPQDINEKINWLKFNSDTSEWTRLADKYLVRDYVKERIGEHVLPKIYGVWGNAGEIDFDELPNQFVLKTNHGCGTVLPVLNKSTLDVVTTRLQLNKWINSVFGYETVEPHYMKISPLIYAEQLLENDVDFSSGLVDYKVFCLSGEPYGVLVCTDRVLGKHTNLSFYNCNWQFMPDVVAGKHSGESIEIPRPACLDLLLEYARKLAYGHPQVRVDFYIVHGNIYFGEMTFTSQGGYMDYISKDYSLQMGQLIKLPSKCHTHQ